MEEFVYPTVGRIVHYISYGTPKGEFSPEHRAAIITAVLDDVESNTVVSLCVLNPSGMFFNLEVEYDPSGEVGGSWHWPER